jgi:predicted DNA-binding transcriptional regulator AlpA
MQEPTQTITEPGQAIPSLLTTEQAASVINCSRRMLESRRLKGNGPPFVRISGRSVRYRLGDVLDWIGSLVRSSTSAE